MGKPLNVNYLLQSLVRLENDPLIKKIDAEINQKSPGKNVLRLNLEEDSSWDAKITIIKGYSTTIGSFGGNIKVTNQNLFGLAERLSIDSSLTEGLRRIGLSYSFPINKFSRLTFTYNNANSQLVEDSIKSLGLEADYSSVQVAFKQPIFWTSTESLNLEFGIEIIDSETFVLNQFSLALTEGLKDGRSKITALRFTQEYVKNWATALLAFRSQFNFGLDAFGATRTEVGIDGIFSSWRLDLQYLKAFTEGKDVILATRVFFQLTPDKLLPIEQFTMGGLGSVLGYRANLGVADNGVVGIIELQLPLAKSDQWGEIKLIPFVNGGNIWNNERETTGSNTFASLGLGLRYRLGKVFEARFNYAFPLIDLKGFRETDTVDNFTFFVLFHPLRF